MLNLPKDFKDKYYNTYSVDEEIIKQPTYEEIPYELQKIILEDPTLEIRRNKETSQLLIGGQGMTHLTYVIDKLKNTYKVDVEVIDQKISYRETIKKEAVGEGKHKKQSGGAGQF